MGSCTVVVPTSCGTTPFFHVDLRSRAEEPSDPIAILRVPPEGEVLIHPPAPAGTCKGPSQDKFGVVVESRILAGAAKSLGMGEPRIDGRFEDGIHDPAIGELLAALKKELEAPSLGSQQYVDMLVTQLMILLLRAYSAEPVEAAARAPAAAPTPAPSARDPSGSTLDAARLDRAIRYIHENLGVDLAVDDIARAVDLSPFHFSRAFKKSTGQPPHRFLLRTRLERARRLLLESKMPLAEVASTVGFYDQSHFGYHFKRQFGATPREVRIRKNLPSQRQ